MLALFDIKSIIQPLVKGLGNWYIWVSVPLLAGTTYLMAQSGLDAFINDFARLQNKTFSNVWSAPPMILGMIVPLIVPFLFARFGEEKLAKATLSAFLIALLVVSVLKGVTSRVHPEALEPMTALAKSQIFRFGFLEAGFMSVVEGWPSGHTATNGVMSLTIIRLARSKILKWAAGIWFIWVALATIFGISGDVHWLSDTLAGATIAALVAHNVSRSSINMNRDV